VPGYLDFSPHDEDFWPKFWKLYLTARVPDAGNIQKLYTPRPPLKMSELTLVTTENLQQPT